jgi:hypothetical protein
LSNKKRDDAYATPLKKLVAFFESSRNKWHARSGEKQKQIDYLEKKVRDLEKSRAKWKMTTKKLQEELKKKQQ